MPKQLALAQAREVEIARLLLEISERTNSFRSPPLVLIGGYALRAYIPFSRATRDCDFAFCKGDGWLMDSIASWLTGVQVVSSEKFGDHGFLRCMRLITAGGASAKVSLDFMEGSVVGREKDEVIALDEAFERSALRTTIPVGGKAIEVVVPTYTDYFILKCVSARRSDIRDIAALVWKLGVPNMQSRLNELLPFPSVFHRKLEEVIIPDIEDARFVHSWRGTFVTQKFSDEDKRRVIDALRAL